MSEMNGMGLLGPIMADEDSSSVEKTEQSESLNAPLMSLKTQKKKDILYTRQWMFLAKQRHFAIGLIYQRTKNYSLVRGLMGMKKLAIL